MHRPYNFSAGPATIPEPVLQQAAAEMLDWRGSGVGVMEMSHRGPQFLSILAQAEADLRLLLAIPDNFQVLFLQGGALGQNAFVPLNLAARHPSLRADYVISGSWSQKSATEALKYAHVHTVASNAASGFTALPPLSGWQLSADASYVHLCSNETIHGLEFKQLPDLHSLGSNAPLVVDASSNILSHALDWSRIGLMYAGAQKNIGPAGLTLVIVRRDLLGHALPSCPSVFNYQLQTEQQSLYNTAPTYAIYIAGLVFQWLLQQREGALTGVAAIAARNQAKADLLYDYIDQSALYHNAVDPACRSRMNVPFFLRSRDGQLQTDPGHPLNAAFLQAAQQRGLLQLRGHKSVGGMRASIYNAMPVAGVQALVDLMRDFERHPPA